MLADPRSISTDARLAAEGDKAGVALMVFPELCLSAYAIDDLLFQDAVLDAVEADRSPIAGERRRCCRFWSSARRCASRAGSTTAPSRSIAAGCSASCRRSSCRTTASSTSGGTSPRARRRAVSDRGGRARSAVRHRPAVPLGGLDRRSRSMSRSARICGCRSRRARAALRRRRDPAQPVGQQHRHRQGARCGGCCARRHRRAASPPTPIRRRAPANPRPTSPGTARPAIFECGDLLAETERFAPDPTIAIADVDLGRIRQERMRTNTFGDMRRCWKSDSGRAFRRVDFDFDAPAESVALERAGRALSVRAGRPRDAARQLLRGLQHPGPGPGAAPEGDRAQEAVIGVSGGLDSTQALIVSCRAMDRLGLPRSEHPGLHPAGLRHVGQDQEQRLDADARPRRHARPRSTSARPRARCSPTSATPSRRARRSTT